MPILLKQCVDLSKSYFVKHMLRFLSLKCVVSFCSAWLYLDTCKMYRIMKEYMYMYLYKLYHFWLHRSLMIINDECLCFSISYLMPRMDSAAETGHTISDWIINTYQITYATSFPWTIYECYLKYSWNDVQIAMNQHKRLWYSIVF